MQLFLGVPYLTQIVASCCKAQPSEAAVGGSQINWDETSFIITAQPPNHQPHPGIVVLQPERHSIRQIIVIESYKTT